MSRLFGCLLALGICTSSAMAQGDALIELYGEGVHRFNAGDYMGANQLFSRVIDGGSSDPRAYFFRGLTQVMQGGDGQTDYEVGARLEAEGPLSVNVGMALIRIQGATRTEIEKARRSARIVALQAKMAEQAQMAAEAPKPTEPPVPSVTDPAADADSTDLFSDEGMRSSETTPDAVQPDLSLPTDESNNPFGDDPAPPPTAETPAEPPADNNPFGTAPGGDAGNPFGTTPASDAGNPFGGTDAAGDAGNPFGGTDAAGGGASDADNPFGTPPAGDGNPFGP